VETRVLLIEDNPGDARLILEMLEESGADEFVVDRVDRLSTALERMTAHAPDAVLLDLDLPDSSRLETFSQIYAQSPQTPIVVLTGLDNEDAGIEAVRAGAQDYLVKGMISGTALIRVLRYGIERKRAEEALRASERRYRLLFENNLAGVVRTVGDGHIVDCNLACAQILGCASREELLKHQMWDFWVDEGERIAFVERLKRERSVSNLEVRNRREDGTPIWVLTSAHLNGGSSTEAAVIEGTMMDITERKRAEAENLRLATAIEQAAEGVVITDLAGTIQYVNPAFTRITGHSREEALGQSSRILRSGRHDRAFYDKMWATILAGRVWQGEITNRRKDGALYPEDMTIAPVRNSNGIITNFIAIKQDVTERKLAEAKMRTLNEELEERVKVRTAELEAAYGEMEAFTYSVSHDLRAPVRHICGFSDMLLEDHQSSLDPSAVAQIKTINNTAMNMSRLIDALLNLSRLWHEPLTRTAVSLSLLVGGVVEEVKRDLKSRKIDWRIGQLPTVDCDGGLVREIFVNLLANAAKYTRSRQHTVIVVDHMTIAAETVFFVRDNGVGFDMKYSDRLFGVFQRLHLAEEYEGTGLGLATVQRIVHKHGGRVWAEAQLDMGATFYFTLGNFADRRQVKRCKVTRPATIRVRSDSTTVDEPAAVVDVSSLGARVQGDMGLSLGQTVDLVIEEGRPEGQPAHVIWMNRGESGIVSAGLQFIEPTEPCAGSPSVAA